MRPRIWSVVVVVGALLGFAFAAFSTYDFVAHLDRQVHGVHCSFLPGITGTEAAGSDCQVTLMSPYSSVLRQSVWGGIPISLPAMSVFGFLAAWAIFLVMRGRQDDERATGFLLLATAVPVLTSAVMAYISLSTLDAACKLCIGIYAASGITFVGALGLWLRARSAREAERPAAWPWAALAGAFGVGVAFVALPVVAYAVAAPDFSRYIGACGELQQPEDPYGVLVPLGPQGHGVQVIEVLDPLCPACLGFEERFVNLSAAEQTRRSALLFPLDDECNWMVDDAIHPGACAVSEAMLCAEDRAEEVLAWSFEEQTRIREAAENDPEAAGRMARERFPELADCIGSPTVRARLNLALRWAVDNQLPVLTPQIYVGATRLCDEDTDLGMEYALSRLIERTPATPPPPATPERPVPSDAVARSGLAGAPDTAQATGPEPMAPAGTPDSAEVAPGDPAQPEPADAEDVEPAAEQAEPAAAAPGGPEPAAPDPDPEPAAPAPSAPAPAAPAPSAPAPAAPAPSEPAPAAPTPEPAPAAGDAPEVTQ